jgi:hypothetical protein
MTGPVRPPVDIHLVCEVHPAWVHDGSHTSLWEHLTSEHPEASPNFTVTASGYPVE